MDQETVAKAAAGPDQLKLAFERTYLAYERTLMAWIRTATSLIGFGFALYKFFFYLREQEPSVQVHQLLGPRAYGLLMMVIGVFSLVLATWQHRKQMKRLRAHYTEAPVSLSAIVAALIATLGVIGCTAAIFRQ